MSLEDLIKKAQNGDSDSMNKLIEKYFPVIFNDTKKYFIAGGDHEDLIQEGMLGLLKAIKYYSSEKSSFNSFLILCVRRQVFTAIKSANSQKNLILNESVNYDINDILEANFRINSKNSDSSPENIFFVQEKMKNFKNYYTDNFSSFEKKVFKLMIEGYSYKEIANYLSRNTKSVDNAIQRIKKKSEIWLKKYNLD